METEHFTGNVFVTFYPNNIHYKLSAGGAKGAVETTPKCTSLNYVLAPQSCPLGLAGFSLVE